jgi:acetyl-CoA synthetase
MTDAPKWYDAHLEEYRKTAFVNSMDEYKDLYRLSLEDPEGFWAEQARKYLTWDKEWDFVCKSDFEQALIAWFGGGILNASSNCLDRHQSQHSQKVAYYWEGDSPEETRVITYGDLYGQVNRMAALLKAKGVNKGDRVIIYMPMIVELCQNRGRAQRGFRRLQLRGPCQ